MCFCYPAESTLIQIFLGEADTVQQHSFMKSFLLSRLHLKVSSKRKNIFGLRTSAHFVVSYVEMSSKMSIEK